METNVLNNMLPCSSLFMVGAHGGIFPGPALVFAMASVILLSMTSLLQDIVQPHVRFSLAQLFFFTTVFAVMLGTAVNSRIIAARAERRYGRGIVGSGHVDRIWRAQFDRNAHKL
jgi:hypothetical protein